MRIQDIISLGSQYLKLGIAVVVLVAVVFLGYYFITKRRNNGVTRINFAKLLLNGVFICYLIVVLGATMLSRSGFWQTGSIQQLFYSYREAWKNFSATEWRNIILNIMMFVPFGLLLPFVSKKFHVFWKTYLAGFAFTVLIEVLQLVLRRGIFELDDLMNNTVGAMIGYGCYRIVLYVADIIKKRKGKVLPVLGLQIPAVLTVITFAAIFGAYENQELGNLNSSYIVKQDHVQVETELELSSEETQAMVYQSCVTDVAGTREVAEEMFARFGLGIDESRTDVYEDEVIYYSDDNNRLNLWVSYAGKTYRYTDFDATFKEGVEDKTDADEKELVEALAKMGITLPEGTIFENGEEGYKFTVDKLIVDGNMYDGFITCDYTTEGLISGLTYNVVEFQEYKEFPIISEREAYDKLRQGMFLDRHYDEYSIVVRDVKLDYELDTKGFYQPVYIFDVILNENEDHISIAAIGK